MKLHTFVRVVALAAALGCSAKFASAAPIVFSDRTAFRAVAGSTSVLTFDDLPHGVVGACLPGSPYVPDPCELDYGGATFVSTIGFPSFNQRPQLWVDTIGLSPSDGLVSGNAPVDADDLFFTFHSNAVGFSVWSFSENAPVFIEVEDINGQTSSYSVTASPFVAPFFGVVSDVALARVSVYTGFYLEHGVLGLSNFGIDDVELQAVPEPSTLALMLGGLMAVARRRRRSNP